MKHFQSKEELRKRLLSGISKLTENVASTLGPKGRNVILYPKDGEPVITKDGVTVAKFVELEDPFENVGAQLVKQVSAQTNKDAGDGTTTATVLANAIIQRAQKYLVGDVSPVEIKRGIDKGVLEVIGKLRERSTPLASEHDIANIATISANGDKEIGGMIAEAVSAAGKDGAITIEDSKDVDTIVKMSEGFLLPSGYAAGAFVTDKRRNECVYNKAYVCVTDERIEKVDDIMPLLKLIAQEKAPLIIVAQEIEGAALAALIMNFLRGTLRVVAVKAPRFGDDRRETLKDLSIATGATFLSKLEGHDLAKVKLTDLGKVSQAKLTRNQSLFVSGLSDKAKVQGRIAELNELILETGDLHRCEQLQERATRLMSGVVTIKVGAPTQIEQKELKFRIEDALEAVQSAQQEGLLPGGGTALAKISKELKVKVDNAEQGIGVQILREALEEPLRNIVRNAGGKPDVILDSVQRMKGKKWSQGYDMSTGRLCDMIVKGIIDPAKVTRCALLNAASVASTILTTDYAIVEK